MFNFSLKTSNSISLNEVAFSGINLTGDILDLLLSFRTNNYVLLADTRKVYQMIRLGLETEMDRFCFFFFFLEMGTGSAVTGMLPLFSGSPPTHLYLRCLSVTLGCLPNRFYVDKLVMTEFDPRLYSLARERLQKGGFASSPETLIVTSEV